MTAPVPEFARTGLTSTLGKLTEVIPAVRVSLDTKASLEREASRAGMTLAEFVRYLLDIRALGLDEVRRLQEERLKVVSGMSTESNGRHSG